MFDAPGISQIFFVAVFGGLIGLDRTALGQFMISQPLVAAPLTGWILGDATTGLVIGAALELVWVLDMPVGTFVPADSTVAAVASTAVAALSGAGTAQPAVLGFSLLLTTAMAPVTMIADHVTRELNARLPGLALAPGGRTTEVRVAAAHLLGISTFFLKSFVLYLVLVPAGLAAMALFHRMPDPVHRAMALFAALLPLLGVASVARKLSMNALNLFVVSGIAAGAAGVHLLHVPVAGAILFAAATAWVMVRYHGV